MKGKFEYVARHYLSTYAIPQYHVNLPLPVLPPDIIVVIPAYYEDNITSTIDSFLCNISPYYVEIIVVLNYPENASEEIKEFHRVQWRDMTKKYAEETRVMVLPAFELPSKKAGVGLARKIGMDEAIRRFLHTSNEGIIVSCDADCVVKSDFLFKVHDCFRKTDAEALTLNFCHQTGDIAWLDSIHQLTADYELHLRYLRNGIAWAGHPYAYHTIGSSMAVKAGAYCSVNGMSVRKAGEDFYFLHKFMKRGTLRTCTDACVYITPRISQRVPFGTGHAISCALKENRSAIYTYPVEAFMQLKHDISYLREYCLNLLPIPYGKIHPSWKKLISPGKFTSWQKDVSMHGKEIWEKEKRFYTHLDLLQVIRFLNECSYNKKKEVKEEARRLLSFLQYDFSGSSLLECYRILDTHCC